MKQKGVDTRWRQEIIEDNPWPEMGHFMQPFFKNFEYNQNVWNEFEL